MNYSAPWWKNTRGEWYVIIQFAWFAIIAFGPRTMPGVPLWNSQWQTVCWVVGLVIGIIGAMLIFWGLLSLGQNLTALPHPKQDSILVESGAYRIVRHPIYSGIIIGSLGFAVLNRSTVMILYVVVLFLFFDIKSRREEKWLSQKFSNYANYQKRVRKLIPFLY